MSASTTADHRTAAGRFAAGQSGNPAGRPKGARNRATLLAEALREGEAEILVRRFVELALAGDRTALRFCVARLVPRLKGRLIELDLAPSAERDPAAIMDAALRAVFAGEITPDEGLALARLVKLRGEAAKKAAPVSDLYSSVPPASSPASRESVQDTKGPARTPAVRAEVAGAGAPPVSGLYFGDARAARGVGDLLASCSKLALDAKAPLARAA
jgi:hypothetical protein